MAGGVESAAGVGYIGGFDFGEFEWCAELRETINIEFHEFLLHESSFLIVASISARSFLFKSK